MPECPRHPGWSCPGECQYLLPDGECINDRGPPETRLGDARAKEEELIRLASYLAGLFVDIASLTDASPAGKAHALWLLIEEAKRRREEWLAK